MRCMWPQLVRTPPQPQQCSGIGSHRQCHQHLRFLSNLLLRALNASFRFESRPSRSMSAVALGRFASRHPWRLGSCVVQGAGLAMIPVISLGSGSPCCIGVLVRAELGTDVSVQLDLRPHSTRPYIQPCQSFSLDRYWSGSNL